MSKGTLYVFGGSVWVHVPEIAVSELGYKPGEIEQQQVNLAEGANFDPNGFLKINHKATLPTLVIGEHHYTDSVPVVEKLIELAPNPPAVKADHELRKLIATVHNEANDPNTLFVLPVDDADREAKAAGLVGGFLGGRQVALDKYAPSAPEQFKAFLEEKQKANGQILAVIQGKADAATNAGIYAAAAAQWKASGHVIRAEITPILKKAPGKFLGGADSPGEADFHVITWLARIITDAGIPPNSPSSAAFPVLAKRTGGAEIDPVVAAYWDTWIKRDSFIQNNVN